MKILEVARYKECTKGTQKVSPFVYEQGEALRDFGNDVHYFAISGNGLLTYFRVKALRQVLTDFKPDIIHAHYGLSGITAVLAAKCKHIPVVITFHNGETLNKLVNFLTSLFSFFANHVIYVAQHIRNLCYCKAKHYSILPCGVNLAELPITDYNEARKQLGFLPSKKYILFGGAFENLRKNYPLLQEAIMHTGRTDIEVLEMRGLSRSECALRMCACDLFALPTHSEGSPQALKEAMACNCPIVATDVADIRHLLGNISGHYILRNPRNDISYWQEDENSVSELSELINKALSFNQRTEGRKRIIDLGLENRQIAEALLNIYAHL